MSNGVISRLGGADNLGEKVELLRTTRNVFGRAAVRTQAMVS